MRNLSIILVAVFSCWSGYSSAQVSNPPLIQVEMKAEHGEYLNTFDSIYVPDEFYFDSKPLRIYFTEEEQKRIIYLADSVNFWDLPDNLMQKGDTIVLITDCPCPCSTRIKTNQKDNTVTAGCYITNESYRHRLRELEYQIKQIVNRKIGRLRRRDFRRNTSPRDSTK